MIEMGVRQKYMIDGAQFIQRQIANARTRIEQDILIDQNGCRARRSADATASSQNPDFHVVCRPSLIH
jgi:hypothetical protein